MTLADRGATGPNKMYALKQVLATMNDGRLTAKQKDELNASIIGLIPNIDVLYNNQ